MEQIFYRKNNTQWFAAGNHSASAAAFVFVECNRSIQYQSWICSFSSQSENTDLAKKKIKN